MEISAPAQFLTEHEGQVDAEGRDHRAEEHETHDRRTRHGRHQIGHGSPIGQTTALQDSIKAGREPRAAHLGMSEAGPTHAITQDRDHQQRQCGADPDGGAVGFPRRFAGGAEEGDGVSLQLRTGAGKGPQGTISALR